MSINKLMLLTMSVAYLVLTLYLFLTNSGIEIILLFAIFSYIFYTPLTAIFKYDIDDIENEQLGQYIKTIAIILFGVLVVYSTGIFSAEMLVSIMQLTVSSLPKFEVPDLMPYVEGRTPLYIVGMIILAFILRQLILVVIAVFVGLWLVSFVFHFLLGFAIIFGYLFITLMMLIGLFFIAYKGKKVTERYVKNNFQKAIIFFSTIISALYLIVVFYINLFTLG